MNPLKQYLTKIQPQVFAKLHKGSYEPKKGDTVKCSVCGRKTHLLNNGKGPLVCCGKAMLKATLPMSEDKQMIHDDIRQMLNESMGAVMGCRAAKSSIGLWQKRAMAATDPMKKAMAQKMIAKKRIKVAKCTKRGMMI